VGATASRATSWAPKTEEMICFAWKPIVINHYHLNFVYALSGYFNFVSYLSLPTAFNHLPNDTMSKPFKVHDCVAKYGGSFNPIIGKTWHFLSRPINRPTAIFRSFALPP
jgi:hypothetical protein